MATNMLSELLEATWQSPVFGDSFGLAVRAQRPEVLAQMTYIWQGFSQELASFVSAAMPNMPAEQVRAVVDQIAPKAVSFCPALAAGEVTDVPRLQAAAVAIGLMYWGDQTMDRGDEAMPFAIELLTAEQPEGLEIPKKLQIAAQAYAQALRGIAQKVNDFALPEDAPYVLDCFDRQVLANEARLHRLSQEFIALSPKHRGGFLAANGMQIARMMVVDAGFPSVSSSLYAIYRQQDPALPPLSEVYANPHMVQLLQVCNVVVRVADEVGDWETDLGKHPEWGSFCINACNQAHPVLVDELLHLAAVRDTATLAALKQAFLGFSQSGQQHAQGERIIAALLAHVKIFVNGLPGPLRQTYALYITLCKRVLEIGYVNRVGDIALAQT